MTPLNTKNKNWRDWLYPGLAVGFLVSSFVSNMVVLAIATSSESSAVEPDYYQKAMAWDDELSQRARNRDMAWQMKVATPQESADFFVVEVDDSQIAPLSDLQLSIEMFPVARSQKFFTVDLDEIAPGQYQGRWPSERQGIWELRARASRGAELFTSVLRHERL